MDKKASFMKEIARQTEIQKCSLKDTDMRKVFILFDVFTKLPPMSKQIVCNWILFSSDLMLVGNSLKTNSLYYYLYPKTTSEQENPLDQLLKLFYTQYCTHRCTIQCRLIKILYLLLVNIKGKRNF